MKAKNVNSYIDYIVACILIDYDRDVFVLQRVMLQRTVESRKRLKHLPISSSINVSFLVFRVCVRQC